MIKIRHLSTLFALLFCGSLIGQELPYNLEHGINQFSYQPLDLATATSVNEGQVWDDPDYSVPIGFDFSLFGETISTIEFGNFVGPFLTGSQVVTPMLIPYGADLSDRGLMTGTSESPILYELRGNAPDRIFIIEWQNAGFYNELDAGTNVSFVNVQMWLYEDGRIEYCYGPNNIVNNDDIFDGPAGPIIGFNESFNKIAFEYGTFFYLEGGPEDPTVTTTTNPDFSTTMTLSGTPPENYIYAFFPQDVSDLNEEQLAVGVKSFPNPVQDLLQLEFDFVEQPDQLMLRLLNPLGQSVYQRTFAEAPIGLWTIDVNRFPAGLYLLEISDLNTRSTKVIVKE